MIFNNMTVLAVLALILSLLPVLATIIFRLFLMSRKWEELEHEIRKLNGDNSQYIQSRGGLGKVKELVEAQYKWRSLLFPALICSFLYLTGFTICLAYVNKTFNHTRPLYFPDMFESIRVVLYTFIGVYLFNFGTLIRRLYLIDLTEQVFWGGMNRLLLSVGLGLAIPYSLITSGAKLAGLSSVAENPHLIYFSIGFLANAFLDWVMELAMKVSGLGSPKREDYSLRMVRGINIWKEYRLEEEGIENAQNLATADVIELAVKTHYPLRTLIDWVDQAMVVCRFGAKSKDLEAAGLDISAIELAWLAPECTGQTDMVDAIVDTTKMNKAFITAQLNSLYEDAAVRELWTLWQTKPEVNGDGAKLRMPINLIPPPHERETGPAPVETQQK
jgi:hypothetical protein